MFTNRYTCATKFYLFCIFVFAGVFYVSIYSRMVIGQKNKNGALGIFTLWFSFGLIQIVLASYQLECCNLTTR